MTRERQVFGGLLRLALCLVAALVMALGPCPSALADEVVVVGEEEAGAVPDAGPAAGEDGLTAQAASPYGLEVGGVPVTDENRSSLDENHWSFSPAEGGGHAVLTLSDYRLDGETVYSGIHYRGDAPLDIVLEGESSIAAKNIGIYSDCPAGVTVRGTGTVKATGASAGIFSIKGNLTIEGGTVTVAGMYGINVGGGTLTIEGGTVTATATKGGNYALSADDVTIIGGTVTANGKAYGIWAYKGLTVTGGTVTATAADADRAGVGIGPGAAITISVGLRVMAGDDEESAADVTKTFADEHGQRWVRVELIRYPLTVGGVDVTGANKDDVLGDADEGATVSFAPAEDGGHAVLTLSGCRIDDEELDFGIKYSGDAPLDIVLEGDNTIAAGTAGIYSDCPAGVTVRGTGSVEVRGRTYGIDLVADLTIEGGTVTAVGEFAISSADLTIKGGTVTATVTEDGNDALSAGDVTISGGTVTASGKYCGIDADKGLTVTGGTVTATAASDDGAGIESGAAIAIGAGLRVMAGIDEESAADVTKTFADEHGQRWVRVEPTYAVKVAGGIRNGTVKVDKDTAAEGESVKVTVRAADGYEIDTVTVTDAGGNRVPIKDGSFAMPASAVTVSATYAKKADPEPTPEPVITATVARVARPSAVGAAAGRSFKVTWKAAKGAKKYQVQWRAAGGKWQSAVTAKGTSYVARGLKTGTAYELRVRGVNGSTRGAWSTPARRWLKGASKVRAAAGKQSGTVKVTWAKDAKANAGHRVYVYAKRGGKAVKTVEVAEGKTSVTIKGLKASKTYYVRMRPMRRASGNTFSGLVSGYRAVKAAK